MSKSLSMSTADPLARNVWLPEILKKVTLYTEEFSIYAWRRTGPKNQLITLLQVIIFGKYKRWIK